MRVIAGTARGKNLQALPGEDITRPTINRVKEAMFSSVQFLVPGARVLDLFAGSGPFELALLDPPFHHDTVAAVLPLLAAKMAPGGVVLCETEREADLPEQAGALTLVKQYNYGKIKVSRYERGEEV